MKCKKIVKVGTTIILILLLFSLPFIVLADTPSTSETFTPYWACSTVYYQVGWTATQTQNFKDCLARPYHCIFFVAPVGQTASIFIVGSNNPINLIKNHNNDNNGLHGACVVTSGQTIAFRYQFSYNSYAHYFYISDANFLYSQNDLGDGYYTYKLPSYIPVSAQTPNYLVQGYTYYNGRDTEGGTTPWLSTTYVEYNNLDDLVNGVNGIVRPSYNPSFDGGTFTSFEQVSEQNGYWVLDPNQDGTGFTVDPSQLSTDGTIYYRVISLFGNDFSDTAKLNLGCIMYLIDNLQEGLSSNSPPSYSITLFGTTFNALAFVETSWWATLRTCLQVVLVYALAMFAWFMLNNIFHLDLMGTKEG